MWKGLSIFAGIILLAVAGLNFMEILPQIQNELQNKQSALRNMQDAKLHLAKAETTLEDHQKLLTSKKSGRTKMEQELADATEANKDAQAKLEIAAKKLADTKEAKAHLEKKLEDLGGLKAIVEELKVLAAKQKENALVIKQKQDTLAARMDDKKATENRIVDYKLKTKKQENGILDDSFSGSISNVDPQFGFISINKGNNFNVVKGAKLDVRRGSENIATLLVTRVLPSSSICDIIPGTLNSGQNVQTGDRVVVNVSSSAKAIEEKEKAAVQPSEPAAPAGAPGATPPAGAPATPAAAAPDPFATPAPTAAPETPAATGTPPAEAPVAPAPATPPPTPEAPATPTNP